MDLPFGCKREKGIGKGVERKVALPPMAKDANVCTGTNNNESLFQYFLLCIRYTMNFALPSRVISEPSFNPFLSSCLHFQHANYLLLLQSFHHHNHFYSLGSSFSPPLSPLGDKYRKDTLLPVSSLPLFQLVSLGLLTLHRPQRRRFRSPGQQCERGRQEKRTYRGIIILWLKKFKMPNAGMTYFLDNFFPAISTIRGKFWV